MNPRWKRKVYRKRRAAKRAVRRGKAKTGGFTIKRKIADIWLSNSTSTGTITQAGTNGVLTTGAPVVNPIFGGVYQIPFSFQFQLDNLPNYTDITGICDRYKITNVTVRAMYNATAVQGSTVSAAYPSFMPSIKYIVDHDDSSAPSVSEMNQKMGLRTVSLAQGKIVRMNVKPRAAVALYQTTGTPYSVPSKALFVNSGYPSVAHYGLKGYLDNFVLQANSLATSCITFEAEYTVVCRDLQ